jgi:hypothetical protein
VTVVPKVLLPYGTQGAKVKKTAVGRWHAPEKEKNKKILFNAKTFF